MGMDIFSFCLLVILITFNIFTVRSVPEFCSIFNYFFRCIMSSVDRNGDVNFPD